MKISEILSSSCKVLSSRYGKTLLTLLAYLVTAFVIGLLNIIPVIGIIAMYIILVPLQFGFTKQFISLYNNEEVKAFDFVHIGRENFGIAWKVTLRLFLKYLGVIILMVISYILNAVAITMGASAILGSGDAGSAAIFSIIGGIGLIISSVWSIVLSLKYMFAYNELAYDTTRNSKEVIEIAEKSMEGYKGKLFLLELVLIVLFFIVSLLSGIPVLGLLVAIAMIIVFVPYMQYVMIDFYERVRNEKMPKADAIENLGIEIKNEPQDPIQM